MVLLSGPRLAFWGVIIWAEFAFYKTLFVKNTIKIGVSALFWNKNCARKFEVLLSGPSWPFLSCSQLGPDNNIYLAQIIAPQNVICGFLLWKICWNTCSHRVFEHQPKLAPKMGKKNDNFSHFAKHRFIKNRFVATPLLTKNWWFSTLIFWNQKHICWTKNIT